jgi:hypothetical protein
MFYFTIKADNTAYSRKQNKPSTVAHACNPSCLGGRHWEDGGLRPASVSKSWAWWWMPVIQLSRKPK